AFARRGQARPGAAGLTRSSGGVAGGNGSVGTVTKRLPRTAATSMVPIPVRDRAGNSPNREPEPHGRKDRNRSWQCQRTRPSRSARSRRRRQSRARGRAVPVHLRLELLDRGEGLLGAQALDEGAAQAPPVQIDVALEQVDLE